MKIKDCVAIVTGGGSGIGEAIAKLFVASGTKVVITGRREKDLVRVASSLADTSYFVSDITRPEVPQQLIDFTLSKYGRFDILINNAGMMLHAGIDDIDLDKMTLMIRTNVEATFRMAYTALRHFKVQNSGFVINTSSIAGYKTGPGIAAYCGTKFAVEAFTDALRLELAGTNIGISAVAPGTVATGLYANWDQTAKDYIFSGGSLASEDIANAVKFILEQPEHVRIPRLLVVPAAQPI